MMTDGGSALLVECPIAGTGYHEAAMVWDQLGVGLRLRLRREPANPHDPRAVAVYMLGRRDGEEHMLGYVPREHTQAVAALLDMGWETILDARLTAVVPEGTYGEQLRMAVRVIRRRQF